MEMEFVFSKSVLKKWDIYKELSGERLYYCFSNDLLGRDYILVCLNDETEPELVISQEKFNTDYTYIGYHDEHLHFHPALIN
ncbi:MULTISPECIES: hypothetical protein [Metabacillus]|uniref:Uncharacterized protein n=1 Tax=Metabacillus endolithicus TaxID=1535204 RepID=A0ABW5C5P2_9BACI|nr:MULTISPECIES: hypothetical protein [Metabacillus]MCM3164517.1 hypothetical protein [Metabacillus litoralis]UPG66076.1 hypothetical protein MVE64_26920 [Metabacillus endolithicus]